MQIDGRLKKRYNQLFVVFAQVLYQICIVCFFISQFKDLPNTKIRIFFGIVFGIMPLLGWILTYKIVYEKEFTYKNIMLAMMFTWIVVFTLVYPFMAFQDAMYHLSMATEYADLINGVEYNGLHCGDVPIDNYRFYEVVGLNTYESILDNSFFSSDNVQFSFGNMVANASMYNKHFLPGIGIALMRFFHIGPEGIMLFAGVPYCIFMVICALIAMKILPSGKLQLIQLMLVPMILNLYTSVHYDVPSIGFSLLYVVFCIYLSQDEVDIKIWHIILLFVGAGILVWAKSVTVCLVCMVLCIPWRKKIKIVGNDRVSNHKVQKILVCIGIICAIPIVVMGYNYIRAYISVVFMEPDVLETCTMSHLLRNPMQFVIIIKNSFKSIFTYTIPAQISYILGCLDVYTSKWLAYLYFVILCGSLFVGTDRSEFKRNRRNAIVSFLTVIVLFFAIGIGSLAKFYPVNADAVAIIGRYALVALIVFFLGTAPRQEESIAGLKVLYLQHIVLTLIVLQSLMVILGR